MMDPGVIGLVSGEATMPVSSFIIQYSNVNYADFLSADADLIITEGDGDDSPRVTEQLSAEQAANLIAQGRLVAGYVNVGVTDTARGYWNPDWTSAGNSTDDDLNPVAATAPAFLQGAPTNDYGRLVDFTDPDWQQIVVDQVTFLLTERGFNAIFLDDVNTYYQRYVSLNGEPATAAARDELAAQAQAMTEFVTRIRGVMDSINPDAVLIASTDPYMPDNSPGGASGAIADQYRDAVDWYLLDNMPNQAALDRAAAVFGDHLLVVQSDGSFPTGPTGPLPLDDLHGYGPAFYAPSSAYDTFVPFERQTATTGTLIEGGDGPNTLRGGDGDDVILTGEGADTAYGGGGNDLIAGSTNTGMRAFFAEGAEVTRPALHGPFVIENGPDALYGEGGDDRIYVGYDSLADGGSGFDTAYVDMRIMWVPWVAGSVLTTHNDLGVNVDLSQADTGSVVLNVGGVGNLAVTLTDFERFVITFGSGDDVVIGGAGNDILQGDSYNFPGGNDTIDGGGGDDDIYGGAGADILRGGDGNDRLNGGEVSPGYDDYSVDQLFGDAGDDLIIGRPLDIIDGGSGYDTLELWLGESGLDYTIDLAAITSGSTVTLIDGTSITGIEEVSVLRLGDGNETVIGTSGNDTIHAEGGDDVLDGGAGVDTARFDGRRSDYTITQLSNGHVQVSGPDGTDDLVRIEQLRFSDGTYVQEITTGPVSLSYAGFGYAPEAGGWADNTIYPRGVADIDGDGRADLIGFGSAGLFAALSNGDGTFGETFLAYNGFGASDAAGGWANDNLYPRTLADVNGDGLQDLIGFGSAGVSIALGQAPASGQAVAFGPATLAYAGFGASDAAGGWTSADTYPRTVADVNGDGRGDLVGFGGAGVYVALGQSDGSFGATQLALNGFGASDAGGGWSSDDRFPRVLADVNNDGRADIVGFAANGTYVALGQSDGSFGSMMLGIAGFGYADVGGGWSTADRYPRTLGDVNGDGVADIIGFGGDGTYVALGRGDGTFGDTTRMVDSFGQSDAGGGWSSNDRFPRFVADIDGDGLSDLVGFGGAGAYVARANVEWVRQSGQIRQDAQSQAGSPLPQWAELFAGPVEAGAVSHGAHGFADRAPTLHSPGPGPAGPDMDFVAMHVM